MKLKVSHKIQTKSQERRFKIRKTKGHDYATEEDILSNFKRRALLFFILEIDVTKSYGIALGDAVLKIDRICNLLFRRSSLPKHETLQDSVDDLKNYIDLMEECLIDTGVLNSPLD